MKKIYLPTPSVGPIEVKQPTYIKEIVAGVLVFFFVIFLLKGLCEVYKGNKANDWKARRDRNRKKLHQLEFKRKHGLELPKVAPKEKTKEL